MDGLPASALAPLLPNLLGVFLSMRTHPGPKLPEGVHCLDVEGLARLSAGTQDPSNPLLAPKVERPVSSPLAVRLLPGVGTSPGSALPDLSEPKLMIANWCAR
jgi:hypothetical protein